MMFRMTVAVIVVLMCMGGAAWAGDIVAMPTGNMVPEGQYEAHYIYWDTNAIPTPGGQVLEHINVLEFFYGATDKVEVDFLSVCPQGLDSVQELNLYYKVRDEAFQKPSLIVGATNLTGEDWLPSTDRPGGDARVSPFVLGACNIMVPKGGPPSLRSPLVRLHLGYGINFHEDEPFGGVQILVHPGLGAGIFNYQSQPVYLVACMPTPEIEIHLGWGQGNPLVHLGYRGSF